MVDERSDQSFWRGKRVLLTGHTGFIGSWLSLWLHRLGAEVIGYSLPPATEPALYTQLQLDSLLTASHYGDIADVEKLREVIGTHQPDIILHLAAQAIVGEAHKAPFETWRVNALGTVAVLEAACHAEQLRAAVLFTTDKVYANDESGRPYQEDDRLGGQGIYDSSKSACELAASSFAAEKLRHIGLATVRAGNVIGGGDWAKGRLVPDCIRAFLSGQTVELRHPRSVRPWQHVLDVCDATLALAERLYDAPQENCGAWNIGPEDAASVDVATLAEGLAAQFGKTESWHLAKDAPDFPEATLLRLDTRKFHTAFGWTPALNAEETVEWTARWYAEAQAGKEAGTLTAGMIEAYHQKRALPATPIAVRQ